MRKKIAVIGAGNVGAEAAREMISRDLGDVWMLDIVEGMPQGKALDLSHGASIVEHSVFAYGTNSYEDIRDSDVVVLTAGVARKPGMTREDLLNTNLKIVKNCCEEIKRVAPNAILIVVTNPLDAMVYTAYKVTNFPRHRIMGMAGVLDSTRFRAFLAMELGVSPEDIHAMVLGTHGDLMVPLPRYANVAGIPITELLPKEKIEAIVDRTRKAGTEIVSLLKTGSAYYAPGAACAVMVESIVRDQKRVMAASVWLEGEYGINNVFAGVPIILGDKGIEKIIEVKLTEEEMALLRRSAEHVAKLQREVDEKLTTL